MWGLRLSVVRSDNLKEVKFRHNGPLKDVDLGLLYKRVILRLEGHYGRFHH